MSTRRVLACLSAVLALPWVLPAEEMGAGHYTPGMFASFMDILPYEPGFVYVNEFSYYGGDIGGRKTLPMGANLAGGVEAESYADTHVFVYQTPYELLGGRYAAALGLTLMRLDVDVHGTLTRNPRRPGVIVPVTGPISKSKTVSDRGEGLGDIYTAPAMLVWKQGDFKYDARLGLYMPTGKYDKHDLANLGKNYWTFEPAVGMSYLGSKNGLEVTTFAGIDINTENPDTDYRTGEQLHLDLTVAQHLPLFKGLLGVGANGFLYEQISGDSGDGAMLGDFEGRTLGVGPVLSYAFKVAETDVALEVKWLPELDTENRLEGDYVWVKAAILF